MTGVKACTRCGETKPLEEFSPHPRGIGGRKSWCKACQAGYARQRRETHGREYDRRHDRAYSEAMSQLRELHRDEFFHLLDLACERHGVYELDTTGRPR